MNWRKLFPWWDYVDCKDSDEESKVISGDGPKRVIVNESEQ